MGVGNLEAINTRQYGLGAVSVQGAILARSTIFRPAHRDGTLANLATPLGTAKPDPERFHLRCH
jgi:hypothetical protein